MRLTKRLAVLEARQHATSRRFDHLSDDELEVRTLSLIAEIGGAGVALPGNWRAQYDRSAIRFLEWLEARVK